MQKTTTDLKTKRKGYYDIDIDLEEDSALRNLLIDDIFYLQDLKQRKLFIDDDINCVTVIEPVKHIMQFNKEDKGIPVKERTPIILYLTSHGGDVEAGFELIDAIQNSKTPVYTVNLGFQYSMGFLIGLAGHKRFATPNATFLMHDGSNFIYNSGAKAQDQMEFQRRVEKKMKQYVLSKSKLSEQEYDSKFRVEWYLFADEAKEKGFVDYIIGKDCDIDEIV